MKKEYTRDELIKICEKSFVKQKDWLNRDSADAQIQLSEAYVLLCAGCDFKIRITKTNACVTDENTMAKKEVDKVRIGYKKDKWTTPEVMTLLSRMDITWELSSMSDVDPNSYEVVLMA